MLRSECCGALPIDNSDDMDICPDCKDHCVYVDDLDEEVITTYEKWQKDRYGNVIPEKEVTDEN